MLTHSASQRSWISSSCVLNLRITLQVSRAVWFPQAAASEPDSNWCQPIHCMVWTCSHSHRTHRKCQHLLSGTSLTSLAPCSRKACCCQRTQQTRLQHCEDWNVAWQPHSLMWNHHHLRRPSDLLHHIDHISPSSGDHSKPERSEHCLSTSLFKKLPVISEGAGRSSHRNYTQRYHSRQDRPLDQDTTKVHIQNRHNTQLTRIHKQNN